MAKRKKIVARLQGSLRYVDHLGEWLKVLRCDRKEPGDVAEVDRSVAKIQRNQISMGLQREDSATRTFNLQKQFAE